MAFKVHKFRDIVEAEIFLRGGIIGGASIASGVAGLVGLSIEFTTPAGSHTFVTANRANDVLLLTDIKTQLEAALVNIRVLSVAGRIAFVHPTAGTVIALAATSQVSKTLLGFDQNTAITGKVYGVVPGTPPALISTYCTPDNTHVFVTNE